MERTSQIDASNRRAKKKTDTTMLILKTFSATSMSIAFTSLILLFLAQPVSFFPMDQNFGIRTAWDGTMVNYLLFVLVLGIVVGAVGLTANSRRLKRSYDFVRINLVLVPLLSAVGLLVYFL